MIILITDQNKLVELSAIVFDTDKSTLTSDWISSLIEFPAEYYDEQSYLGLTRAQYEDFKICAQNYANCLYEYNGGVMLVEDILD